VTAPAASDRLFALTSLPARWASRLRPGLRAAIDADAAFYAGPRRRLYLGLLVVGILYPLGVSIFRAVADPAPAFNSELENALFPVFYRVYAESMPFMLAVVGVGIFSPTIAVLMLGLFLPDDILASAWAHAPGAQLIPLEISVLARILSVGVLWVGVVEIPLAVRRWVARHSSQASSSPPRWLGPVAAGVGMGFLAYIWANAVPWLIQPVHSWTVQGGNGSLQPLEMLFVGFYFAWIFAVGVGILGFAASMLRGPEPGLLVDDGSASGLGRGLRGEILTVVVLGFLGSGLFYRNDTVIEQDWNLVQAVLIIGSLILAGPVMTRLLPRLPTPAWLGRAPATVRWLAALLVTGGGAYLAFAFVPPGSIAD